MTAKPKVNVGTEGHCNWGKKPETQSGHCYICKKSVDAAIVSKCTKTTCMKLSFDISRGLQEAMKKSSKLIIKTTADQELLENLLEDVNKIAELVLKSGLNLPNSGDKNYEEGFLDALNYFIREFKIISGNSINKKDGEHE